MAAVYSYIRFSTPEQSQGHSASRQLEYAKQIAHEKGLVLDDTLNMKDEGLSAYHQNHIKQGALGAFLTAISKGRVPRGSILIIEGLDRLSRAEPLTSQALLTQIIDAGITVITASDRKEYNRENLKKNPMDLIYSLLVMIRAHEESDTKSKRVKLAIKKQCDDWVDGRRGFVIRNGKDPKWLKWNKELNKFEFNELEKAKALRIIELYKKGYGAVKIVDIIIPEFKGRENSTHASHIYKIVRNRILIGEKKISVMNEDYQLKNYYPKLMSDSEFASLQSYNKNRARSKSSRKFVCILSGMTLIHCGYCSTALTSHISMRGKKIDDVPDGHKRFCCISHTRKRVCQIGASISIVPIEKAVLEYCQDKFNLDRILGADDEATKVQSKLDMLNLRHNEIQSNIDKLTDALLVLDTPPQAIAKKINSLEADFKVIEETIQLERSKLLSLKDPSRAGLSEQWQMLTGELKPSDIDKRLQVRQLVKDTFSRIEVFSKGISALKQDTLVGYLNDIQNDKLEICQNSVIDLVLRFHNGVTRYLRVDKSTGEWLAANELLAD